MTPAGVLLAWLEWLGSGDGVVVVLLVFGLAALLWATTDRSS